MLGDDGLNIQTALVGTFVYSKKIGQCFACGMRHLGETAQHGFFWAVIVLPSRQLESGFEGAFGGLLVIHLVRTLNKRL